MGKSFGYSFDEVHIKKGIYAPQAHAQTEDEHLLIRRGIIRLLYGEAGLKMDITSLPANEDEAKEQKLLRKGLIDLLKGKKVLPIKMEPKDEA